MTFKIDRRFLTHKIPLSSDGACKAPFAAFRRDSDPSTGLDEDRQSDKHHYDEARFVQGVGFAGLDRLND
ncbi:MAG: hypothetical protein HYU62_02740 [Caulobacterales bacterium]|nr:hypothetical protein [Caulobacterales bacterium]